MVKKRIFRIHFKFKGEPEAYKLVEGTSIKSLAVKPKSTYIGTGGKITGITQTKFKGSLKARLKMPRSKRFGKGFY